MWHKLKDHIGHKIECVSYGQNGDIWSVSVECIDCSCVLVDAEPESLKE